MRTYVRALGEPEQGDRRSAPGCPGLGDSAWFGPSTLRKRLAPAFTRSSTLGDQPGPERSRMPFRFTINPYRGCTHGASYLLLRPPHPHLPRPQRARGLRARDRGQGQPAGAAAGRARAAVVAGRARRARHQHRPLSVGRGPLPADPRRLGGDARLRQPVLGADQVAASAARPRPLRRACDADRVRRQPLDPDPRGAGLAGDRAPHATPAHADRGGRRAGPATGSRPGS